MIKIGIVGGTGYTGAELLRLLAGHPNADLVTITSRSEKGVPVSQLYPNLRGIVDLPFSEESQSRQISRLSSLNKDLEASKMPCLF